MAIRVRGDIIANIPSPEVTLSTTIFGQVRTRQLELLAAIDRHGSLRKAALALGLPQPAATRLLRSLEEALGHVLFVRTPRGLLANAFGEVMLRHARIAADTLDRAERDLAEIARGGPQRVRIGAVHSAVPFLMARAIARLKRERPGTVVQVSVDTSNNLMLSLVAEELDILVARPWEIGPDTDITYEQLIDERLVVVGGPGHPLEGVEGLALRDLVDRPFALLPQDSPMRRVLAPLFREGGVEAPADLVETGSMLTIVALLGQSNTLAVLPEDVARFYEDLGSLVRLSPVLPPVMGAYGIVTRRGSPTSLEASIFLEALRATSRARQESIAI